MNVMSTTKHSPDCRAAFGRRDAACPRCRELAAGATPRGWAARAAREDAARAAAARAHDCAKSGCGPVCTHGDW